MLSAPPAHHRVARTLEVVQQVQGAGGGRYGAAVWNERMSARSCVVTVDISESTGSSPCSSCAAPAITF